MKNLLLCFLSIVLSCGGVLAHDARVPTREPTNANKYTSVLAHTEYRYLAGYDHRVNFGDGDIPSLEWGSIIRIHTTDGTHQLILSDGLMIKSGIGMGVYAFQELKPGACCACPPAGDSILYVDSAAANDGDGLSWATAFNKLSYALELADSCDQVKQIWVGKGTYKPYQLGSDDTVDRNLSFVLIPDLKIFGGFAGNEPAGYDFDQRDFKTNETILSGDIGAPGNRADNCYHVVIGKGDVGSALLDGFTITGGNADKNGHGGGMYLQNSSPLLTNLVFSGNRAGLRGGGISNEDHSSPILSHITFSENWASSGGGMFNGESSPMLTDVIFSQNQAGAYGGAIFNAAASPALTRVTISGNVAAVGGGMYNNGSTPILTDVTFSGNTGGVLLGSTGGGMFNQLSSPTLTNVTFTGNRTGGLGGGMANIHSSPTLVNVTFSGNQGSSGGGMSNRISSPRLMNVSFSGNSADSTGGAMFNSDTSAPKLTNVILWNNEAKGQTGTISASIFNIIMSDPMISFSLIANSNGSGTAGPNSWARELGIDGGGNIDSDPLFFGAVNPGDAPTLSGDLHLAEGSPAIDMGDSHTDLTTFPKDEHGDPIDLDHQLRVFNGGNGGHIDMGAYEHQGTIGLGCPPAGDSILYVDSAVAGGGNGFRWATAFHKMQHALDVAAACGQVREIWVAKGTYMPDMDSAFFMLPGVKIYGGFAGTETSLGQRDLAADHRSILKGNGISVIRNESNGLDTTALLDGFTITGGRAGDGGGIHNVAASPALRHLVITGNSASNSGGGISNANGSSPVLDQVTIRSNTSSYYGGGIANNNSSPLLTHVSIDGNTTQHGGGIYNYNSSPVLINVSISADTAYYGGGISNWNLSSPALVNVTISRNEARYSGGGIHNLYHSSVVLINSIVWGNNAGAYGGDELNSQDTSSVKIYYSLYANGANDIVTDASSTLTASDTLTADPHFVDAAHGNYSLTLCSPAVNNGSNRQYSDHGGHLQNDIDLKNNPRLFGEKIDMGVYEFQNQPAPPTVIHVQPDDTAVCGQEASFSISATGYRLSYQWQSSKDGKIWNAVTGGTEPTLRLSNIQQSESGTLYRVILISGCQNKDTSAMAVLTVTSGPVITSQPEDQTVFEGSGVSFGVSASDATGYQWQLSDDHGETWTNVTGGTNATMNLTTTQRSDNGSQYRVVVTGNCGHVTSRPAMLTVRQSGSCITIAEAPHNQTVCPGSDVTFSINASGATGYQWQSSTDGNTWQNVAGGTSANLERLNVRASDNGNQYRVIVQSDCGSITSGAATLTVRANVAISKQPGNQTICEGGTAAFSVKATGANLTYQWQSSSDGITWNNETNETRDILELSNLDTSNNGTKYHVVVSSRCGNITSRTATLTIHGVQHKTLNVSVCQGGRYRFAGKDISKSGTYTDTLTSYTGCDSIVVLHLEVLPAIKNTLNETICEGDTYTVGDHQYTQPGSYTDTLHTVNGCDSIMVLHLQVSAKTIITAQPQNQTICAGGMASFHVKADGTNLRYQWQASTDGATWNSISGETSETLNLPGPAINQSGTQYRVLISSPCGMVTSGMATLAVRPKATISLQPQDQTVCAGEDAAFRVKAEGTNLTFQWQSSADGNHWSNVSGGASEILKRSNVQVSADNWQYRVVIASACDTLRSNAVVLRVNPVPAISITADRDNPVSKGILTHLNASGADTYQWVNSADIQSGWNEATLAISPRQQATYTVTGTTAAGCSATQDYQVTVVADYKFRIHNIVTPNGDGKNDTWIIENIQSYPDNKVEIFDRSGRMIYHQKNYSNQWDGTVVGSPLQEGTYYYILAIDGEKKLFKGFIEVLRGR